jgi:hypothetical protein
MKHTDQGRSGPVVKIEKKCDGEEGHMVVCRQGLVEVGTGPVRAGQRAETKFP